jgi:adenosylcobalamin-dependent ribonucleoside-triphosphate reductase
VESVVGGTTMNQGTVGKNYFEGSPLGKIVYDRTYSRTKENGEKENWFDTVKRVIQGNIELVDPQFIEPGEAKRLEHLILNRIALPGGRHLWSSGTNTHALQNCFRSGFDRGYQAHASFMFNQLMLGGGVGANYSSTYFSKLQRFRSRVVPRFVCGEEHNDYQKMVNLELFEMGRDDPPTVKVVVEDSREGWVNALEELIWHSQNSVPVTILYDVTKVRPEGRPIVGFGGTAAGPMPLMLMLKEVAKLLNKQIGKRPDPLFAMAVDHAIAGCVVAGNVRRSARMSILHWNDPFIFDFINCKKDSQVHWSTNISVEVDQYFFEALDNERNPSHSHANAVLEAVTIGMLLNGEPGLYNSSLASEGEVGDVRSTNPCGEITLENFESCILGHVNVAFGTEEERLEAFRLMARFLVRTTCAPMKDPKTREIVQRNRRIGVGFLGLQEFMAKEGLSYAGPDSHMQQLAKHLFDWQYIVRYAADEYADQLGIPRSVKVTTVAPTGTIAKLAGTTEGIQPLYSKYYIRNLNYADTDHQLPMLKDKYDHEMSVYAANTTVISVPTKDSVLDRLTPEEAELMVDAGELSPDHALRLQALVQQYFADNAISLTVNVQPDHYSVEELKETLVKWLPQVKGMTVFPEQSRPQSPLIRITKEEYEKYQIREVAQPDVDQCIGSCPVR